jgi:hypothetical protein
LCTENSNPNVLVVKDISRLGPHQDVMRGVIERFDGLKGKLADPAAVNPARTCSDALARAHRRCTQNFARSAQYTLGRAGDGH